MYFVTRVVTLFKLNIHKNNDTKEYIIKIKNKLLY